MNEQEAEMLLGRASGMADRLGDESWKHWSQAQAHEVEQALDDLRSLVEKLGSECNRQIRANGEMRVVLNALLNLFDPPGDAKRRPDGRPIVQTERWRDEFCRLVAARDAIVVERDQARRCSAAWKALAKRQQHRIDAMREYTPDKEDADK